MAASASKYAEKYCSSASSKYPYRLTASFSETATSTANNTSTLSLTVTFKAQGAYWSTSHNSTLEIWWYDNNAYSKGTKVASMTFAGLSGTSDSKSKSGSITVTHKSDGSLTGYALAKYIKGNTTSGYAPASFNVQTASTALTAIPRQATITNAPDFTDEENPTITYSNPAGTAVTKLQACIAIKDSAGSWTSSGGVGYRDISTTGTSYTFNLTDAERTALRTASANSNTLNVAFFIRTYFGDTTLSSNVAKTMTVVNANPTATCSLKELNSKVSALLGTSGSKVVKGVSNLQVTITPTAKKNATIKSVNISDGVTNSGGTNPYTFNKITSNKISYDVTDSRSNGVSGTKNLTLLDYNILKVSSVSFERKTLDSNIVVVNAKITGWSGYIDSRQNTATITWEGSNGTSGTISNFTFANNEIVLSNIEIGEQVNSSDSTVFILRVEDLLTSASGQDTVTRPIPTCEAGVHDFQINGQLYVADENRNNKVNVLDKIENVNTLLTNFQNSLKYKKGDTFTLSGNWMLGGCMTSSNTELMFSIPVNKSLENISSITVNTCKINIRHADGGYVGASGYQTGGYDFSSVATLSAEKNSNYVITIHIIKKSGNFGYANNTTIAPGQGTVTVTFS